MKIDINKLESNGYIVDQNKAKGIIRIYQANGNTALFDALHKTLDDFDVKHSGMLAENIVIKINNQKIMDLCED